MPKATKRSTQIRVKTPLGVFAWPFLDRPSKKFAGKDNPEGDYKVDVVVEPGDIKALKRQLEELVEVRLKEEGLDPSTKVHYPFVDHLDENKQPTGKTAIRCKQAAAYYPEGEPPVPHKIAFMDARGQRTERQKVGAGTRGVVFCRATANYVMKDDTVYVRLRPEGVQVVDLVEFGGFNQGAYGGAEDLSSEGSFVADQGDDAPAGSGEGAPSYGGGKF